MNNEIEQLKREIRDYETEIKKLQAELNLLTAVAPQPKSSHPTDIANAFRIGAIATAERVIDSQAIKDAIAALEQQLAQKRSQLHEVEKQQQKLLKQKRVEEARHKLRSEIERINRIASDLESAYLDLKQIHNEFNPDLKSLSDALPGTYQWQLEQLVHFNNLNVPVLEEKNGIFVLGCRLIDLFKPEKDAKRRSQAERAKQNKLATDAVILASQQRKTAEKQQHERERIEEILNSKKTELQEAEASLAKHMEQVARGVRLDLSNINSFIAATNVEIERLEKDLDALKDAV